MAKLLELYCGEKTDPATRRFALDLDKLTLARRDDLTEKIQDIERSHHPLVKNPRKTIQVMEPKSEEDKTLVETERLETFDEWQSRALIELADKYKKLEDESDEDHKKRVFKLSLSDHKSAIALEVLNAAAEVFKIKPLLEEEYQQASYLAVKETIVKLMEAGDITDDFFRREER